MPDFCPASSRSPPRQQNRRRAEVVVRSRLVRTVRAVVAVARAVVGVAGRDLPVPNDAAVGQRQRDHGIARRCDRLRVVVARCDVDQPARCIDGRRRPDRGPGRTIKRRAAAVLAELARLVGQVRLPEPRAVAHPQRDDAAAERAARVIGIAGARLLPRRHRHVGDAVVHRGCGRQSRRVVRLDLDLPNERAGRGLDGIEPARQVAEQQDVALARPRRRAAPCARGRWPRTSI